MDQRRQAPRHDLVSRETERLAEARRLDRRDAAVGNVRVLAFALVVAAGWLAFRRGESGLWMLPPALAFTALVIYHARVITARLRAERAAAFYRRGLSRLDGTWPGSGDDGARFADEAHPYAADLDLFGKGGLFELLCEARTAAGQETLAAFVLGPAPLDVIVARQRAVAELALRLEWREALAVEAEEVAAELSRDRLSRWATSSSSGSLQGLQALALAATLASLVTLLGWAFGDLGPYPFLVAVGPLWLTHRLSRRRVETITSAVSSRARELHLAARILALLEDERFQSAHLESLRARLAAQGRTASTEIAALGRLVGYFEQTRNQLLAPLAIATLLPIHCAFAIERWRRRVGSRVPVWLDTLGELEALASLAGHAFLHPDDPFPELDESGATFAATALGHPLLDEAHCIRNDVALGGDAAPRVLLVSGSNMSGKSTLLRSVGTNLVLAMAGAPVRARALRTSPLALGSTLRIQDSLHKGASRFYAEITRLRDIVARAARDRGEPPLLFLLDELLAGTNSHDRLQGAAAILHTLVDRGAIGLCTTHDLALTAIIDGLGSRAANVHFEDHLEGDRIAFDYRLRGGVVTRSNAVALMRAVGLPVGETN